MADEPIFYWDACILLEHFRDEQVSPTKRRALARLLQENKEKKNRIITSVVTHVEVLPKSLSQMTRQGKPRTGHIMTNATSSTWR
jgi:hypothetical protein